MKTEEKPNINNKIKGSSFRFLIPEEFCKSANDFPAIYEINPGTIGKTHGERKLKIPAKKAIVKGISWDIK